MTSFNCKLLVILCLFFTLSSGAWAEDEGGEEEAVAHYHNLTPPFVANFGSSKSKKLKFLKADVSVRASSADAINVVMKHDALIRHQIVMLLSRQKEEVLSNSAGQEAARLEALSLVKAVLKDETGDSQIDDLFFTSFVVQR